MFWFDKKYEYEYNNLNKITNQIILIWSTNDNNWHNNIKTEYTYNENL